MKDDHDPWTWVETACTGATRVLHLRHLLGDTFVIEENGEVSLSDGATLKMLLEQLSGRARETT